MKIIRPIGLEDLDALLHMAQTAGTGFTSLPPVADYLREKIELSMHSFATDVREAGHERYMFVLEETDTGEIGGCCACLLYTSPSPRDRTRSRMPSSA